MPLWKRDPALAGVPPSGCDHFQRVHPKPAVGVTVAAEAAQPDQPPEERVILYPLENPDDFCFYHEFAAEDEFGRPLTADTDRWPQRLGIDWDILPADDTGGTPEPYSPDFESPLPEPHAVPPGLRPFTLVLGPSRWRSNLMEGRSDEALAAKSRTVTMMRSREQAGPMEPEAPRRLAVPTQVLAVAGNGLADTLKNLRSAVTPPSLDTVRGWVDGDLAKARAAAGAAGGWIQQADTLWKRAVQAPLQALLDDLCATDDRGLSSVADRAFFRPALAPSTRSIKRSFRPPGTACASACACCGRGSRTTGRRSRTARCRCSWSRPRGRSSSSRRRPARCSRHCEPWLHNFRRIRTRHERHAENYLGFVHLGCIKTLPP